MALNFWILTNISNSPAVGHHFLSATGMEAVWGMPVLHNSASCGCTCSTAQIRPRNPCNFPDRSGTAMACCVNLNFGILYKADYYWPNRLVTAPKKASATAVWLLQRVCFIEHLEPLGSDLSILLPGTWSKFMHQQCAGHGNAVQSPLFWPTKTQENTGCFHNSLFCHLQLSPYTHTCTRMRTHVYTHTP